MWIGSGNRSTRRKPAPVPLCSPQIPRLDLGSNPGRRGVKSATNRLGYCTASMLIEVLTSQLCYSNCPSNGDPSAVKCFWHYIASWIFVQNTFRIMMTRQRSYFGGFRKKKSVHNLQQIKTCAQNIYIRELQYCSANPITLINQSN
jgi:hypothetical protein